MKSRSSKISEFLPNNNMMEYNLIWNQQQVKIILSGPRKKKWRRYTQRFKVHATFQLKALDKIILL